MKEVTIYTDGACSGNPGPGGWAAVLRYGEHVKEMSGFMPQTTNNRMEIMAAIQGLGALKQPCSVTLCSDSAYLVNAFEKGWIQNWQRNGWKNAAKEPVENQDLWTILLMTIRRHGHVVRFTKVPGHADDADNNRKLMADMAGVPDGQRGCRFVCAVALARRGRPTVTAEGACEGVLLRAPRGENGFGYDPYFYYPPAGRTFAELTGEAKNAVSHRRRALESLRALLAQERR